MPTNPIGTMTNPNDVQEEVWKTIPSWRGVYEASSLGNIRSVVRYLPRTHPRWPHKVHLKPYGGKVLSPKIGRGGYLYVNLWIKNKGHMRGVHRLVCEAFISNTLDLETNHKDGNKQNNKPSNLEWVTRKENLNHAYECLGVIPIGEIARRRGADRRAALQANQDATMDIYCSQQP